MSPIKHYSKPPFEMAVMIYAVVQKVIRPDKRDKL